MSPLKRLSQHFQDCLYQIKAALEHKGQSFSDLSFKRRHAGCLFKEVIQNRLEEKGDLSVAYGWTVTGQGFSLLWGTVGEKLLP